MKEEDESPDETGSFYSDHSDESSLENTIHHQDLNYSSMKKNSHGLKTISVCSESSALQIRLTQKLNAEALVIRISTDGLVFAVGLTNGDIRLFRLSEESSQELVTKMKTNLETLPCTDIQFPAKDTINFGLNRFLLLASYASGFIRLWHYTASYLKSSLVCQWEEKAEENTAIGLKKTGSNNQILCLSISYDGRRFVSGGTDTHIRVYCLSSTLQGRVLEPCIRTDTSAGHTARVTALAYHPRGKWDDLYTHIFASAGWDNCIHIWDDQKAVSLWQYYGPHIAGNDGMDIDPLRNLILTCAWRFGRSMVQMWKFPEFVVDFTKDFDEQDREKYNNPVGRFSFESNVRGSHGYVAQFDPTYQYIVFAGSNENVLCVMEVTSNTVIAELKNLEHGIYSASVYLDSNYKNRLKVIFTNGKSISLGRISTQMPNSTTRWLEAEYEHQ